MFKCFLVSSPRIPMWFVAKNAPTIATRRTLRIGTDAVTKRSQRPMMKSSKRLLFNLLKHTINSSWTLQHSKNSLKNRAHTIQRSKKTWLEGNANKCFSLSYLSENWDQVLGPRFKPTKIKISNALLQSKNQKWNPKAVISLWFESPFSFGLSL